MVACGNCLGCKADRARDWAVRITHETITQTPAWFVTLTYADQNLPDYHSLDPEHPRAFLKRLRRHYCGRRLSYFLCGEYGEKTKRPHYHAVLCGAPLLDRDSRPRRNGAAVWHSQLLEDKWEHGFVDFTSVSYGAAAYVAGYVRKKVRKRDDPTHYSRVDPETGELVELVPEFSSKSRRPALGRTYLEQYWRDIYPRDFVTINGSQLNPPRYYDKWMEANHPEIMEEVRYQRYIDSEQIGDEKLIMKEKVHRARVALFNSRDQL